MGKFVIENYDDKCTEAGFQFEFRCERCGKKFQSDFVKSKSYRSRRNKENAGNLASFFGSLFGGKVEQLGNRIDQSTDMANNVSEDKYEAEKKAAFKNAEEEAQKSLFRCKKCGCWFCEDCYDAVTEMCRACTEEAEREEEARRHEQEDREREEAEAAKHICPKCGRRVPDGMKFCGNCGTRMIKVCPKCGTENDPQMNFCTECGTKL